MKLLTGNMRLFIGILGLIIAALLTGCTVRFGKGVMSTREIRYPPFVHAAQTGNIDEADQLVRSGQVIDQQSYGNQTALYFAAAAGQDKMVEWLLSHEANPGARDLKLKTPADLARERGKLNSEKLIKESNQKYIDELHALQKEDYALAKELMKTDPRHYTLLHLLALFAITEPAIKEIRSGADINARSGLEQTPLHEAARSGDVEIAKALIKAGADINAVDIYNETALQIASGYGKRDLVAFLLASGADKNTKATLGNESPLEAAKRLGRQDIVDLLQN